MVLKNIVDIYNLCNNHMGDINEFEIKLKNILLCFDSTFSYFFNQTLPIKGSTTNSNYASNISSIFYRNRSEIEHKLTTLFTDISTISIILNQFENYQDLYNDTNNIYISINNFIIGTNKIIFQINNYFSAQDNDSKAKEFYNLYLEINKYLITLSNLKYTIELLNNIYNSTSYNTLDLLKDDSYATLEIQYFRKELSFSDMTEIMESTEKLYNKLCEIFNVSLTEYKLKPIKIESGSIFEILAGNAPIIAIMEILFKNLKNPGSEFTKFIYRNNTNEGLHKNACEFFKSDLELFECAEKLGLEIPKDIAEENLLQIAKHTNNFLNKGKFKINGNEIISENPEQFKIAPNPQIEDSSLNVNESDINSSDDDTN